MSSLARTIEHLFDEAEWSKAAERLESELVNTPSDHWLLERLATAYYEQKKYDLALKQAEKAHAVVPDCPLALWTMANCLDMLGNEKAARKHYLELISLDPWDDKAKQYGACQESTGWMLSIQIDCIYRLALRASRQGKFQRAIRLFHVYLMGRETGIDSIYSGVEAVNQLNLAQHGMLKHGLLDQIFPKGRPEGRDRAENWLSRAMKGLAG
jgi:tetratricopeptide (TPR) repeat protein